MGVDEIILNIIIGAAGGASAIMVFWVDSDSIKIKRAISFIFLGMCGAFFVAPVLILFFELSESYEIGVKYGTATVFDFILRLILQLVTAIGTALNKNASNIVTKILDKFLK